MCYAMVIIRSMANPAIDMNNPEDPFKFYGYITSTHRVRSEIERVVVLCGCGSTKSSKYEVEMQQTERAVYSFYYTIYI